MKAIIPAAGLGTRLRPLTFTRPKPVLRVAGAPIIRHAIESLRTAGIVEIGVVVSGHTRDEIAHVTADIEGIGITFISQDRQLGLGHAVLSAREWVGEDDFCVYLGDNLFQHGVKPYVDRFSASPDAAALVALAPVPDPSAFGVAEMNGKRIGRLVEKPKHPVSNLAVAGFYCFRSEFFSHLQKLSPSARGEYEITDAIQAAIENGEEVLGEQVLGWWKDTGQPADLLDANRLLLEAMPHNEADTQALERSGVLHNSRVSGRVQIPASCRVINSKIVGPVLIGENVVIEDAYIGPFTSIGDRTTVRGAEIEHSVIEAEATIEALPTRLQDCLIGLRAKVRGGRRVPSSHRLTISDASEVELA